MKKKMSWSFVIWFPILLGIASLSLVALIYTCAPAKAQTPGDCDGNGLVTMSDPVYLITYIFGGGPEPRFADATITLKWPAPGSTSDISYADRYRVIRRQHGSEFFDTLFEFPAGTERGGDTVKVTVSFPPDGMEYEWQVMWRIRPRYEERDTIWIGGGYTTDSLGNWIPLESAWHTIPGLIVAKVGKSWRHE